MHVYLTHPMLHRFFCGSLRSTLSSKRGTFSRSFKSLPPGAGPHDYISRHIGHSHDRIIERGLDISDPGLNDLTFFLFPLFHAYGSPFTRFVPSWVSSRSPSWGPFEFWHWSWFAVLSPADICDGGGRGSSQYP